MLETEQRVKKSDILKIYTNGCKSPKDFKVGLEYERLPISTGSLCSVDYWEEFGIKNLLERFAQEETWDFIYDEKNIIGLKNRHDTITLEPGSQVEISAEPQETIFKLKAKIESINDG